MIRIRFCAALLLAGLFAVPALAQDNPVRLGFRAGPNFGHFRGPGVRTTVTNNTGFKSTSDSRYRVGIELGAHAIIPLVDELYNFQPEINFVRTGTRLSQNRSTAAGPIGRMEGHYQLDYLQVPLLMRFASEGEQFRLFALIGPSFGFALGGKVSERQYGGNGQVTSELNQDINFSRDSIRRFDAGIAFGIGAVVTFERFWVGLDGRFTPGLSNLFYRHASANGNGPKPMNTAWVPSIVVVVPLHRVE